MKRSPPCPPVALQVKGLWVDRSRKNLQGGGGVVGTAASSSSSKPPPRRRPLVVYLGQGLARRQVHGLLVSQVASLALVGEAFAAEGDAECSGGADGGDGQRDVAADVGDE